MGSANIQGDLWSQSSVDWADIMEPMHQPLFEAMLEASGVGAGTRLLDAGCGGGGASQLAVARGAQVSGLDAAESMINVASQRVLSGDFRVGDIEALPYDDNAFDAVIAPNSVQYAADRVAALCELGRVCASDGRIVAGLFGSPDKVAFRTILQAVGETLHERPPGDGPFGLSAPGKLEALMADAGLTVLESLEVNCPFTYPDFDTFWQGNASAGPVQGAMRIVGEQKLKVALQTAVEAFYVADGSIYISPNMFKYVVARV